MGYYIETPGFNQGKAEIIAKEHGGKIVSFSVAKVEMNDPNKAVIIVVSNAMFEAAAFAYDMKEFNAFTQTYGDNKPKKFVILPRKIAKELTKCLY